MQIIWHAALSSSHHAMRWQLIIQLVSRDHVCRFENESQHSEMMV
jgi:hypothetical protein